MCLILHSEFSERVSAACCVHGLGLETVSAALDLESPSRIGGLCWVHAYWFSATYRLPQRAFSFSELCLWRGMYRFYFCFALWDSVLESLGGWALLPPCLRALHSPSTLEGRVWWLPLTGLSWIPFAFGPTFLVSGTIPQAYLL